MKKFLLAFFLAGCFQASLRAQELYVFAEPASNMPAGSISFKITDQLTGKNDLYTRSSHRISPVLMFGFSKKLMVHAGSSFSNMYSNDLRYESWNLYAKYRFISNDDIHRHFRMAFFADASKTRAPYHFQEVSLKGDRSGFGYGLIATQLWNKLAISGTVSQTQLTEAGRKSNDRIYAGRIYQTLDYSLSAGYLLFPREYTNYNQTNLNLYVEFLGQKALDADRYYFDLAPAVQLIFNSNTKLNLGARFQLSGNMTRMSQQSYLLSLERTFLNAIKKKRKN